MRRWLPVVILALFALFIFSKSVPSESELKLVSVFQKLHIEPATYVLHYGSPLESISQQESIQLLHSFGEYFHLPIKISSTPGQGMVYASSGEYHAFDITMRLLASERPEKVGPYFTMQVIGKGPFNKELLNIKKHFVRVLRINKQNPEFHFAIQGYSQTGKQNEIMEEALHLLRSKKVEAMKAKTVSVSAYSPVLGEPLRTAGGEMNVQIATREEKDPNRLLITMGTPIITIEY